MFRHDEYGRIQEITHSRQEVPVLHPERIERNATLISRVLPYYEHNIINAFALRGIKRESLMTNERTDILRAIYRAMALTAAGFEGCTSHSLLAPLDVYEFKQMMEAMDFLKSWFVSDQGESLKTYDPNYLRLKYGNAVRALSYLQVSCKLTSLETDLMFIPVDDVDDVYLKHWESVLWGHHTIVDGGLEDTGSGRGVLLGGLLPRLEQHWRSRGRHGV